jgi:uncharacterized protein
MSSEPTYVGKVLRVAGSTVLVEVARELPSASPIVKGRIHRVGQIGTFVKIVIGFHKLYGMVSTVGVSETFPPDISTAQLIGRRWMEVQLVGEATGTLPFQRGISLSPTIDDEVRLLTSEDLQEVYTTGTTAPIAVGHHASSESLHAVLDLQKLVTRHGGIFGSTGSGKSNTVAVLVRAINKDYPGARIIIFDPHSEYSAALSDNARTFSISSVGEPLVVPYWALPYDEFAWFFMDKRGPDTLQDMYIREKVFEWKVEAAKKYLGIDTSTIQITVDSPIPFDLKALWYELDFVERATFKTNQCNPGEEEIVDKGDIARVISAKFKPPGLGSAAPFKNLRHAVGILPQLNRIAARLRDRRFAFLCDPQPYQPGGNDLDQLLESWLAHGKQVTIFDLGGVPSDVIELVVSTVSRVLFETSFWGRDLKGVGRQAPLLSVFEEAHSYLPTGNLAGFVQGFARRGVQRLVREGRKYGLGVLLVSQRPSELDETIMSQCGTMFALRLSNPQDQSRVTSVIPDSMGGILDILPVLRTGEAVLVGEALPIPSRVRFPLVEPRPRSDDPDVKQFWSQDARTRQLTEAVYAWRTQGVQKTSSSA